MFFDLHISLNLAVFGVRIHIRLYIFVSVLISPQKYLLFTFIKVFLLTPILSAIFPSFAILLRCWWANTSWLDSSSFSSLSAYSSTNSAGVSLWWNLSSLRRHLLFAFWSSWCASVWVSGVIALPAREGRAGRVSCGASGKSHPLGMVLVTSNCSTPRTSSMLSVCVSVREQSVSSKSSTPKIASLYSLFISVVHASIGSSHMVVNGVMSSVSSVLLCSCILLTCRGTEFLESVPFLYSFFTRYVCSPSLSAIT